MYMYRRFERMNFGAGSRYKAVLLVEEGIGERSGGCPTTHIPDMQRGRARGSGARPRRGPQCRMCAAVRLRASPDAV